MGKSENKFITSAETVLPTDKIVIGLLRSAGGRAAFTQADSELQSPNEAIWITEVRPGTFLIELVSKVEINLDS